MHLHDTFCDFKIIDLTLIVHYKYFLLKICWGERLPERPTAYLAGDLSAKILKYFEMKKPYSINAKK